MALSVIAIVVPETEKVKGKMDLLGALTGAIGSSALVFGFISAGETGWASAITMSSFIIAIVLFALFIRVELKVVAPLLKLSLLQSKQRRGGLAVMAIIVGMHFATLFLILQYYQEVLGFNPLLAGLAYLPLTAVVFTVANFVPRLVAKFGVRTLLITSCIFVAASLIGFSRLTDTSTYLADVLLPLFLHSTGVAMVFIPGSIVILEDVDDLDAGIMSGVLQISQQIGGAVGLAAILSIYTANLLPHNFSSGFNNAFLAGAGISVLAAMITFFTIKCKSH